LETLSKVPEDYLNFQESVLSKKERELLSISLRDSMSVRYFIQEIYDMDLPEQIGYMYIKNSSSRKYLNKLILDETLAIEYRIYALLRLTSIESNPFSAIYIIENLRSRLHAKKDPEAIIAKEIEEALRNGAEKILNDNSRKLSTGDNYLDSLEAEMLFTAAAVSLHEKYPDASLTGFLKQLKHTFVRDGNTEFIVSYSGSDESEYVRIAMSGSNEQYINSIIDFVESIYKRNNGDEIKETGREGSFKSIAKGHLALISIQRRQ
jgi:hypothetical protein